MIRSLYHRFYGDRIYAGPFRGLHYLASSVGSVHSAKLLGVYEREIWPQVERLIALQPDVVVNVGAAEGYYAVGLAQRLPGSRIIAFEGDERGQGLIREFAARNGVGARVDVRGFCAVPDLAAALVSARRPAVVMDVEGAERELLDPARVPDLARAQIRVEVHDFVAPIGDLLLARFAATHTVVEVWSHPRCAADLPGFARLLAYTPARARVLRVVDEQRPERMRWFWFEPRQS